eukprot:gene32032-42744_t
MKAAAQKFCLRHRHRDHAGHHATQADPCRGRERFAEKEHAYRHADGHAQVGLRGSRHRPQRPDEAEVDPPLWFTSLVLSTALLAVQTFAVPQYFTQPNQLFPSWPEWHPEWAIALFSATALIPAAAEASEVVPGRLSSVNIMGLAMAAGLVSVALISALAMMRRRRVMETENRQIRSALSDAKSKISRYESLIADKNRRIVVWDGQSSQAEFLGQLPIETGAPASDRDFLAFGRWLKPRSAGDLDKAIEQLRSQATSFDMVVETNRDEVLEAQGRVSGGRAFVRFVALNNLRAELAELQIERERLQTSIRSFQSLLDAIDMPSWQRDRN